MGPPGMWTGDIVAVLFGHPVPVILRPIDDNYLFVGECFVYGLMDGEAVQDYEDGKRDATEFIIR
jgi:hypothetical protein